MLIICEDFILMFDLDQIVIHSQLEELEGLDKYRTYLNRRIMDTNIIQMGSLKAPHNLHSFTLTDNLNEHENVDNMSGFTLEGDKKIFRNISTSHKQNSGKNC